MGIELDMASIQPIQPIENTFERRKYFQTQKQAFLGRGFPNNDKYHATQSSGQNPPARPRDQISAETYHAMISSSPSTDLAGQLL